MWQGLLGVLVLVLVVSLSYETIILLYGMLFVVRNTLTRLD